MAKKKKDVEDKGKQGENDDSDSDSEKRQKIYEVRNLNDYFFMVRDIFSDFKTFINDTNDVLNTTLGAVKEIVPMIINGNTDYEKIFQIIDSINSILKHYVDKQNNLIKKITSASDILSKDIRWDRLILDMIYGVRGREKTEKSEETKIVKINEIIPSFSIKENEQKIIEELFGVKHIDVLRNGNEKEEQERENTEESGEEKKKENS